MLTYLLWIFLFLLPSLQHSKFPRSGTNKGLVMKIRLSYPMPAGNES